MRKALVLLLIATFFCPALAHSASVGRITTAGQGKVYTGFEQDYILDKDLKIDVPEELTAVSSDAKVTSEIESMSRSMAEIGYGITDNIDVYTKLGVAQFNAQTVLTGHMDADPTFSATYTEEVKGDPAFAYGLGVKGVFDMGSGWLIGGDAQYLSHENDYTLNEYYEDSDLNTATDEAKGTATVQEWQVALTLGKKIESFTPYVGVKYSDMKVEGKTTWDDDSTSSQTYKADNNFGAFVGLGYNLSDKWVFNVEGRFIDETAVALTAGYKF